MHIDHAKIGMRIRFLRMQKGVSQEDLAELAEVSRVYISNIERGEKGASLDAVISIAAALNVSVGDILEGIQTTDGDDNENLPFNLLFDCSKEEIDILISFLQAQKQILRQYKITK